MLELIGDPQIHIPMDAFEELRVDKVLLLREAFFAGEPGVVPQAPEIVRIIAIRGLEAGDVVFFWKEDSGAENEDQLGPYRIQGKDVYVRCPDGGILLFGLEKTGGDATETPVGLEGTNGKWEGQQVLIGGGGHRAVLVRQLRQFDGEGDQVFFAWEGIDRDPFTPLSKR